jgi:hypothetical protein
VFGGVEIWRAQKSVRKTKLFQIFHLNGGNFEFFYLAEVSSFLIAAEIAAFTASASTEKDFEFYIKINNKNVKNLNEQFKSINQPATPIAFNADAA